MEHTPTGEVAMNCSHSSSSPMKSAGPLGAFSRSSLKSSKPYEPPLRRDEPDVRCKRYIYTIHTGTERHA